MCSIRWLSQKLHLYRYYLSTGAAWRARMLPSAAENGQVQAELAKAVCVPAASSPPSAPRDPREAGREYWRRQQQRRQQHETPKKPKATALQTPNGVRSVGSKIAAASDPPNAQDQSAGVQLQCQRRWSPPLRSPPHSGWRSASPLQQQRRRQQEQKHRRQPQPDGSIFASESRTGRRHRSPPP